jgi:hypothetical protein
MPGSYTLGKHFESFMHSQLVHIVHGARDYEALLFPEA